MAGEDTVSQKSSENENQVDQVVTDAAHPLFLEPSKKDVSVNTNNWRYYCEQCNERLINKDAFLNKHFEKKYHEPVTTCKSCKGNVYEYFARHSHALYHKCKKRGEYVCNQDTNQNYPIDEQNSTNSI
ncbi:hypothetical protein PGB90_003465 [Kerria lacca]